MAYIYWWVRSIYFMCSQPLESHIMVGRLAAIDTIDVAASPPWELAPGAARGVGVGRRGFKKFRVVVVVTRKTNFGW
jgi:hypothetical protein